MVNWFKKKPKVDHAIEHSFTIRSIGYFRFKDISKIKCIRAFHVGDFYNELAMRCDRDYLIKHCETMEKVLSNPKQINIGYLAQLNMQLKERLDMIYETDLVYKIASVIFFDETEDPYDYDDKHAKDKIAIFKNHTKENSSFFFDTLFKSLIDTNDLSDQDLQTYMEVGQQMTRQHLANISTMLSSINGTSGSPVS